LPQAVEPTLDNLLPGDCAAFQRQVYDRARTGGYGKSGL